MATAELDKVVRHRVHAALANAEPRLLRGVGLVGDTWALESPRGR